MMEPLYDAFLTLLIPSVILLHLFVSPYTKVEESFNIQAAHDILTYGIPTSDVAQYLNQNYDHVSFPGSVPRTFTGALVLAGLSKPWTGWLTAPEQRQLLVRAILGLFNAGALLSLRNAVARTFGPSASKWYVLFQASQFHIIYYASRTLPNMYAFGMTTIAMRSYMLANLYEPNHYWSKQYIRQAVFLMTLAGVVFRSEIAIFLATHLIYLLLRRRASLKTIIPAGLVGAALGLAATVSVDSFFWQKFPLWPELVGFYYNTILGKSSEWGVSPWDYYFTNALPKLLLNPLTIGICTPTAITIITSASRSRSFALLIPSISFIGIYSLLPHKEWRFIIYVVPSLTAVAAAGADWIWKQRLRSGWFGKYVCGMLSMALVLSVLLSFLTSSLLLAVSSLNYPGGEALTRLHSLAYANSSGVVKVHLDNLSCQTGVTRFLQLPPPGTDSILDTESAPTVWVYDKTEDESTLLDPSFWTQFNYALAESPARVPGSWDVLDIIYGFSGVRLLKPGYAGLEEFARRHVTKGWWLRLRMEPKVWILQQERGRDLPS
ncbi:alpha-1,6-mannosyltransferase subunit Ecm39 [Rhizodiscina lignyota]|uniref:Mannosyltransferase n=1 Tax=Rhizodiscina lignyota TaxID=1504668 RepID=A0A9P4IJI3_9PEZI|nr:alpha-1,6-mannosyltransferase subunit Ecm39 [Rhizodiscina lignyota]